jgi:hypothetical protein
MLYIVSAANPKLAVGRADMTGGKLELQAKGNAMLQQWNASASGLSDGLLGFIFSQSYHDPVENNHLVIAYTAGAALEMVVNPSASGGPAWWLIPAGGDGKVFRIALLSNQSLVWTAHGAEPAQGDEIWLSEDDTPNSLWRFTA